MDQLIFLDEEKYYLQPQQIAFHPHKSQDIITFDDPLVLKILIHSNTIELNKFCQEKLLKFRVDLIKKPAFIEVFESESRENGKEHLKSFCQMVSELKKPIPMSISMLRIPLNDEEYLRLQQIESFQEISKCIEVKHLNFEGSSHDSHLSDPQLITSYSINDLFILKLMKITNPSILKFSSSDLLVLNVGKDLIFTDTFGHSFSENNPELKKLIKKNKKQFETENMIFNLPFSQENSKEVILCIETATTEEDCIQNIKELLQKIRSLQIQIEGFINLGISLNQCCSSRYFSELLKCLISGQADSFQLQYPGEIQIFLPSNKEESTLAYFQEVVKYQSLEFNQKIMMKAGQWSYESANLVQSYRRNNFFQNLETPFDQYCSEIIERAFLQKYEKEFIVMDLISNAQNINKNRQWKAPMINVPFQFQMQRQQYPPPIENQQPIQNFLPNQNLNYSTQQLKQEMQNDFQYPQIQQEEETEQVEIDLINFSENFVLSNISRPITQNLNEWLYYDEISSEFVPYEKELQQMLNWCFNKRDYFQYKRTQFPFDLVSSVMEINFKDNSMRNLKTGEMYNLKRIENSKFDYLLKEVFQQERSSSIKMEEIKPTVIHNESFKSDELNNYGPILEIRGQKNSLNQISKIYDNFKSKWITHIIPIQVNVDENHLKHLKELGQENNLVIQSNQKLNQLEIRGYRKTINKIRSQILKILEIKFESVTFPSDWIAQTDNVGIYDCPLNDASISEIISTITKSVQLRNILKIERIQNINLWKNYQFEKQRLLKKGDATEKWLFHGTKHTKPSIIFSGSEEGFDFRLARAGKYGRGTYFHDLAQFSQSYAYRENNRSQIFCAKVLIGKCSPSQLDSNLTAPPFIPESNNSIRYDSVRSNLQIGNNEFIIFNNNRAYPYYLITFNY